MNAAEHAYDAFRDRLVRTANVSSTGEDCPALYAKLSPMAAEYVAALMFDAALIIIERQREELIRMRREYGG